MAFARTMSIDGEARVGALWTMVFVLISTAPGPSGLDSGAGAGHGSEAGAGAGAATASLFLILLGAWDILAGLGSSSLACEKPLRRNGTD